MRFFFIALVVAVTAFNAVAAPADGAAATTHSVRKRPNIILILIDDLGWRDVGFAGNTFVETPNLDALARGGVVFTQAYASAPNCAPTRASLMSGLYPPRHGIYTVVDPRQPPDAPWQPLHTASESELDTRFVTVAESLKAGGYATGFFGMWNLGRGRTGPVTPGGQGFDRVVFPENVGFAKDAYFNGDGKYLSDRLTDEVIDFAQAHRDEPFFAYYADHAVHAPFEPKRELLEKYQHKRAAAATKDGRDDPAYAATIEAVDQNVGRIVSALARLKLTDDTLIVFTSDNGGTAQYTTPLHGGKGELYEGGIRVPLLIAGAGVAAPGRPCDVPVASIDLYPTLLDAAGLHAPKDQRLDGVSLLPILRGDARAATKMSRPLFWHFPCYVGRAKPSSAVRDGDFKLIEFFEAAGRRHELYNLRDDPNESHDLAETMPDKAAALSRTLLAWQRETQALIPDQPNPNYDPNAQRPRGDAR